MYTKEQLLSNSSMSKLLIRKKSSIKGVLTTDEQNQLAKEHKSFQVISNGKVFWFTDDYCMGVGLLPNEFVPSSTICPHQVVCRDFLPDGFVKTVEDFVKVYHAEERQITSIDELVTYLNTEYPFI